MRREKILAGCVVIITILAQVGIDVSGYENFGLAVVLWVICGIASIVLILFWLGVKIPWRLQRKKPKEEIEEYEVTIIKVPPEMADGLLEPRKPKRIHLAGDTVKIRRPKRKDDEV